MGTQVTAFRYDPLKEHLSFDYYGWQAVAIGQGATEIVFGENCPFVSNALERFYSILAPGPGLVGLSWRFGDDGEEVNHSPKSHFKLEHLVKFARERRGNIPRVFINNYSSVRYTVTLRQQTKSAYRNSDVEVWCAFAKEIDALVIEDYDISPISLENRLMLYQGASMNFGVASGPMFFCTMSAAPCMSFDWGFGPQEKVLTLSGLAKGENMPWCRDNQFTLWDRPNSDMIREKFRQWKS